ncbi:hypothetical protein D3C71_1919130 [compost metagenome]
MVLGKLHNFLQFRNPAALGTVFSLEGIREVVLPQLFQCHPPDEALTVRGTVNRQVVDHSQLAVPGQLNIQLNPFCAHLPGQFKGCHSILRRISACPSVG